MLVFSTQLFQLFPLSPSLWFKPPPPPLCEIENKYIVYTYTVCKGERVGGMGFGVQDRLTPAAKSQSLYMSIVLDDEILHCLL